MAESLQTQIESLRLSINGLEAQRSVLGDKIVDPALAALRQQLAALEDQLATQAAPIEERRMVTILFMDMVGSTSLAEKLDPEEWRQIVSQMQAGLGEAISAHTGTVAQYLGDGILAFFGSKLPSEHDPENAIRAALDGQATVANLNVSPKLQLRAGIHTGLVVVGELGDAIHKEFTASGDAMNLAARLQAAAPPGGTLISHDTYRYVRGVFDLTPQPLMTVKGRSEPIQTYLVRRAKPRPFRSVARGVAGVEIRTIGREQETQALQAAYLRAYEGQGMVWAELIGEPGVGKSRLVADMTDWIDLRPEPTWLLRARAFPDDTNQPFALIRRMWFDRFQIAEDAPLEYAEAKWVQRFTELYGHAEGEEAAHALGLLVGLPFYHSPYIKEMRNDPSQVKGRALVVSRELIKAVRQQDTPVILLEDMQWTEQASWEYFREVFLTVPAETQPNGLFILGAARPEWQPPQELSTLFSSSSTVDEGSNKFGMLISLAPLSDHSIRQLAQELLQRAVNVPNQVFDLLVERSEGIPYFTEELINWFIDHDIIDTNSEPWRFLPEKLKVEPLPATLQHLVLTRLSALSQPERAALQRGAIFGRRFWTGGVEALGVPAGEETLGHLQPRGFVEAQAESAFQGDTEWSFHQNLLQEVTYESVLKRERAALHKVAAEWLEKQARQAGRVDEFSGLLGDHYERAGELSAAADWYLRAGKHAFSHGAPREAKRFYSLSLNLLPPVDRERRWQALLGLEEAFLVVAEAVPWRDNTLALLELARSFSDDNYLAEAYIHQATYGMRTGDSLLHDSASQAALEAARRSANAGIEAKALSLIAVGKLNRGDISTSVQNVEIEEALRLARQVGDENVLSVVLGRAAFYYGYIPDFVKAYSLFTEQIELDHRLGNRSQESNGLGNLAEGFIWLGMFRQARQLLDRARKINEALGLHRALAYNSIALGKIYRMTGDLRKAREIYEQALEEISLSKDARGIAYALNGLGLVMLVLNDATGAARRFKEAHEIAVSQRMAPMAAENAAPLAYCAVMEGHQDEARTYVSEAWAYLSEHGLTGLDLPEISFRYCAEVFEAIGELENSRAVIKLGYQALMKTIDTVNDPGWRRSALESNPDIRAFMDLWEHSK